MTRSITMFEDALSIVGIDLDDPGLSDEERELLKSLLGLETRRRRHQKAQTSELVFKSQQDQSEPFDLWRSDPRLNAEPGLISYMVRRSMGLPPDEHSEAEKRYFLSKPKRLTIAEAARLRVF